MEDQKPLLFTLFRVQVFVPDQLPLFISLREPVEFLKAALLEKPTVDHPRGSWHVGNVTDISPTGLYFAIGKQLPRQMGALDDSGDFHTLSALVAPNTHVLLDLHYQVLGIAKNSELAPASKTVARKLQKLLQAADVIAESKAKVDISAIDDPAEFVELLEKAAAVTKFQVSFSLPNVWDADEDFQKPFQKTSREAGASNAAATFKGEDLERGTLVKLTRAAAAVGKRTKAWIRRSKASKPVAVTPKENPATHASDPPPSDASQSVRWASETLLGIRKLYEEIRSRDQ
jgi:hypothetical protein